MSEPSPRRIALYERQRDAAQSARSICPFDGEAARVRVTRAINGASTVLLDAWLAAAIADIRATEIALGLPPAVMP